MTAPAAAVLTLLQLADATFPSGGFAHSGGLEARVMLGGALDLEAYLDATLRQVVRAQVPFVRAAARAVAGADPGAPLAGIAALDAACDVTLLAPPTNRASRAQGRALARAAAAAFGAPGARLARYATLGEGPAHQAPVFGALAALAGLDADAAATAFAHGTLRTALSAAVRLGLLGPLEAQLLHAERLPALARRLEAARDVAPEDVAQTDPLLELFAGLHDQLETRLFQS